MKEYENDLQTIIDKAKKYDELMESNTQTKVHCSFCGKNQDFVYMMIAGKMANICNECVEICNQVIADGPIRE